MRNYISRLLKSQHHFLKDNPKNEKNNPLTNKI